MKMEPILFEWATPSRHFENVEGQYEASAQKWSKHDVTMVTTYSRSATTGIIFDDPDEDKDD